VARTLNATTYALRRDEILDAAERLMRVDGYERMTIQDILDELGVSKGAFYHYFDSKEALLEAVVARMADSAFALVAPIVADPALPALAKLQAVFATAGRWKAERSDVLLSLARAWYSDRNDVVRLRLARATELRFTPLLAQVVRAGATEGVFDPTNPDQTASVLVAMLVGSGDAIGRLLIDRLDGRVPFEEAQRFIAAYSEAIERVLGLPRRSFVLVDDTAMHVWFA
jgi:AcrR family transcriptional regulator